MLFVFFTIILYLSIYRKKTFIFIYLFFYVGGLGFYQQSDISPVITDVQNIIFLLNITSVVAGLIMLYQGGRLCLHEWLLLSVYAFLTVWGGVIAFSTGNGPLSLIITDAKEIFTIGFVFYCFVNKSDAELSSFVVKSFVFVGVSISIIMMVHLMTGIHPPSYTPIDPNNPDIRELGIHIRYPLIISASALILFDQYFKDKLDKKGVLILVILLIGSIIQPRDSVKLMTIASLAYVFIFGNTSHKKMKIKSGILLLAVFAIPLVAVKVYPKVDSLYTQVVNAEGSAGSRLSIGFLRIEQIQQNPIFGVGFVHKYSPLGQRD